MNKHLKLLIVFVLLSVLTSIFLAGCANSSNDGDKFIMGGTFRLAEGKTINGNLSVFGGAVSLEKGSTVNGNVVLIGGTVYANGTINGGVNGMGGSITLGDSAVVQGDVSTFGANVDKSDSAVIQGKVVSQSESGVEIPNIPQVVAPAIFKPLNDAMGALLRSLVISLLAVLTLLFLPRQTSNVKDAIDASPLSAGAIGLLTLILFPFVILILAITIILIPLSLAAIVIFGIGLLLGWIAIGMELGKRIASIFKAEWAPAINAGVGTFFLSLLSAVLAAVPCVGWVIPFLITLVAAGGVVISAFGTRGSGNFMGGPKISVSYPPNPPEPVVNQSNFQSEPVSPTVDSIFETDSGSVQPSDTSTDTSEAEKKPKTRARKTKPDTDSSESTN
jgi:hypothetical protein